MSVQNDTNKKKIYGLTDAEVAESRRQNGANVMSPPKRTSLWKLYIDKYRDPIIKILLVTAAISLVLAFIEKDFIETIGIFIAIFLATTVGFIFERDAAKKFNVLTALSEEQPVKVKRNGHVQEIPRRDVVVGDVLIIEVGDEIPADGMLIDSVDLQIDESSLTGEQIVSKYADVSRASGEDTYPVNQVLRSSMVMNGRGVARVTAVGDHTEIGKVARQSTEATYTKTPLNTQLDKLAKMISKIGSIVAISAFVIFLGHDLLTGSVWHTGNYIKMAEVVLGYFMMAVTLIVMAVPEGLPMAVTLSLALNMRRMLKSHNLVRKLHACETMGAVTVICTDKTGTLTQNIMRVNDMSVKTDFPISPTDDGDNSQTTLLSAAIALNTTAYINDNDNDDEDDDKGIGNPTEVALLGWLRHKEIDYRDLRETEVIESQLPFSTERKYMATVAAVEDRRYLFVKGAPEIVSCFCTLTDKEREQLHEQLLGYQQRAMRTLAFAYCELGDAQIDFSKKQPIPDGLTFQAVAAISDPLRGEVPSAVAECVDAGIKVKIVTGDTSATAIEIAKQIGVWNEDADADKTDWHITGADFAKLSDEDAYNRVESLKVMSRARPADKQRLVQLLQNHGEVVAVTGDGTNDAPALNYAHVGLSLGSGTSVAKQASDMTLLDDSFGSIVSAVMWGRSLYKNIQRFLFFQLVVNLTALLLVLAGSVIGTQLPLTVTQILWINLIMDTFAAMALASLPPSHEVMKEKPRKQTDFIITRQMSHSILFCGITFFILMFAMLIYCEYGTDPGIQNHELTIFFTAFVMLQFWNLFNAKTLGSVHSAFRHFVLDKGLILVLLMVFAGQWIIVTFGGAMFRTESLSLMEWVKITAATSVVLWAGELWRWIKRVKNNAQCTMHNA
jgi:Ca2+-transporting ATPase